MFCSKIIIDIKINFRERLFQCVTFASKFVGSIQEGLVELFISFVFQNLSVLKTSNFAVSEA